MAFAVKYVAMGRTLYARLTPHGIVGDSNPRVDNVFGNRRQAVALAMQLDGAHHAEVVEVDDATVLPAPEPVPEHRVEDAVDHQHPETKGERDSHHAD